MIEKKICAIGIESRYTAELIYFWDFYQKPCKLTFMKSKVEGLTKVKLLVDNYDTVRFVTKVKESLGCQIVLEEPTK